MNEESFGSGYRRDWDDRRLLHYLDGIASIPAVAHAKLTASRALELQPGDRALDVGCGTGVDISALAHAVGSAGAVVGLDPSAEALAVAQGRFVDTAPVTFKRGRVEALPFEDNDFDACRMDRTLQHLAHPELGLAEVHRVLRPGGRLVILELGTGLSGAAPAGLKEHILQALYPPDDQAWVPLMLPVLLPRAGFGEVAVRTWQELSTEIEHIEAAVRLDAALEEGVDNGSLAPDTARTWRTEVDAALQRGELQLLLRFFQYTASATGAAGQLTSGRE